MVKNRANQQKTGFLNCIVILKLVFSKKRKNPITNRNDEAKNADGSILFFGGVIKARFTLLSQAFQKRKCKSRAFIWVVGYVKC